MSSRKHKLKKISKKDDHYEKIISRMERDIEKLKAKNKELTQALKNTEEYVQAISRDKTVQDIIQEIIDSTEVNMKERCPNCGAAKMKLLDLGRIKLINCSCGYRNRLNESGTA